MPVCWQWATALLLFCVLRPAVAAESDGGGDFITLDERVLQQAVTSLNNSEAGFDVLRAPLLQAGDSIVQVLFAWLSLLTLMAPRGGNLPALCSREHSNRRLRTLSRQRGKASIDGNQRCMLIHCRM